MTWRFRAALRRFLVGADPDPDPPIVVLRDLDAARSRLAQAIAAEQDEAVRAGLQKAAALLDDLRPADEDLALAWADRVLTEAGVDPVAQDIAAVKVVRAAVPGDMPLLPAALLTRRVAAARRAAGR